MTFAAVVVVYNMSCDESPTCRALEQLKDSDLQILIYDNSTADFGNRALCEEKGWVYLGGNGNVGISKAYNACIDYLMNECKVDMLCLFDDDTHVDKTYFSSLRLACDGSEGRIFVPLIYAGGHLISPCILGKAYRVTLFSNEEEALCYRGDCLSAINSGMALRLSLFNDYRYDENIFLDGVDHNFVMDMRGRGERITVFPYKCDHSFSGIEKPSIESSLTRFRIYAKDYSYIFRNDMFSYFRLVGKRALHLTVQYRTMRFMMVYLNR